MQTSTCASSATTPSATRSRTGRRTRVEAEPMDRVLDLLHKVKYEQDGTLTFRRSCAHGVCGSDAMLINGRNRLACKIRVDQLRQARSRVAPLPGPAGDQGPRRRHGRRSSTSSGASSRTSSDDDAAARARAAPVAGGPRALRRHHQVHPVRRVHDRRARRSGRSPSYVGPAAIVNAHRFIFDSRDDGARGAARDPGRQGRRVALPDDLQLHRRLPARDQHHAGDPRGQSSKIVERRA